MPFESLKIDKTRAAIDYVLKDAKRLITVSDILLQVLFIGFYVFAIWANLKNAVLLIVNSVLLGLGVGFLIFHLCTVGKTQRTGVRKARKYTKRAVNYIKLMIRLFTLGLSVYEILTVGKRDLYIVFTIVTAVGFILQVLLECLYLLFDRYTAWIKHGIEMDKQTILDSKAARILHSLGNPKATALNMLNLSVASIAGETQLQPEQPARTKKQQKMDSVLQQIAQDNADKRTAQQAAKSQEKKEQKQQEQRQAANTLKANLKAIFSRKNKQ